MTDRIGRPDEMTDKMIAVIIVFIINDALSEYVSCGRYTITGNSAARRQFPVMVNSPLGIYENFSPGANGHHFPSLDKRPDDISASLECFLIEPGPPGNHSHRYPRPDQPQEIVPDKRLCV